jgi:hypothetical protein
MATTKLVRPSVRFYAASARVAGVYRSAAQRNKSLARSAELKEELLQATRRKPILPPDSPIVVLSHPADDVGVLTRPGAEPLVAKAFQLVLAERDTHPEQIAQWIERTQIRAESRLHVASVPDLDAPQVSQMLGRVCIAYEPTAGRNVIVDVCLSGTNLLVRGTGMKMLHVPTTHFPALRGCPAATLANFEIDSDGSYIYWPDLDVHLGWHQFLQATNPEEYRKAQQRFARYNERYGAAIRKVRMAAGLHQKQVEGLTDRQLRRIERGQCKATVSAMTALANAHGLDLNDYMRAVADAMERDEPMVMF